MKISETIYDRKLWDAVKNGGVGSNAYHSALGFNLVRIRPNLGLWNAYRRGQSDPAIKLAFEEMNKIVTGVMVNEFSYSLDSEWETVETPLSLIDIGVIGDIIVAAGGGEMGAVYRSKKLWKRSGYLTVTPKIKIIDINGNGLPLTSTRILLMFCTAMTGAFEETARESVNRLRTSVEALGLGKTESNIAAAQEELDKAVTTGDKAIATAKIAGNELAQIGTAGLSEYLRGIEDAVSLKVSPPPLIVEIGRIFKHEDMVLTSVSFTFSQEMTAKGPLYVEVDLTLSTRQIINGIDNTGMTGVDGIGATVEIVQGGNVVDSNSDTFAAAQDRQDAIDNPVVP